MRCMKDMHHTNLMRFLCHAEYDEITADWIAAVAHAGQNEIATQLVRGRKLGKSGIARINAICKFCRCRRILKLVCDVLEHIE